MTEVWRRSENSAQSPPPLVLEHGWIKWNDVWMLTGDTGSGLIYVRYDHMDCHNIARWHQNWSQFWYCWVSFQVEDIKENMLDSLLDRYFAAIILSHTWYVSSYFKESAFDASFAQRLLELCYKAVFEIRCLLKRNKISPVHVCVICDSFY